jgi:hypothetical protein
LPASLDLSVDASENGTSSKDRLQRPLHHIFRKSSDGSSRSRSESVIDERVDTKGKIKANEADIIEVLSSEDEVMEVKKVRNSKRKSRQTTRKVTVDVEEMEDKVEVDDIEASAVLAVDSNEGEE